MEFPPDFFYSTTRLPTHERINGRIIRRLCKERGFTQEKPADKIKLPHLRYRTQVQQPFSIQFSFSSVTPINDVTILMRFHIKSHEQHAVVVESFARCGFELFKQVGYCQLRAFFA